MPIYEYRCSACSLQREHLQKHSDPLITHCPSCGEDGYTKLLSAAGFQLKGSGWYVTDFKGDNNKAKNAQQPNNTASGNNSSTNSSSSSENNVAKSTDNASSKPASSSNHTS